MGKECCKDNVFLLNNLEASVALLPSTWGPWEFSVGFGIIADYKLCDQHKVVIHVLFSKITLTDEPPLLWFLKQNCNRQRYKANVRMSTNYTAVAWLQRHQHIKSLYTPVYTLYYELINLQVRLFLNWCPTVKTN